MSSNFTAHNELEKKLIAAQQGQMDSQAFMTALLAEQVFMPVEEESTDIQGFQRSAKANPLTLETEDGQNVLILFTSPERAKPFLENFPAYRGGLLTDFGWILERIGSGIAISLNPELEVGIDFDTDTVEQLKLANNSSNKPSTPAS